MANYHDITIALSGVCQAVSLVQKFANQGQADQAMLRHSLNSLLVTAPDSALSVYHNQLPHLSLGIETLLAQFGGRHGRLDAELGRYWISVLALSLKLSKNPSAKLALSQRLQQIQRQYQLYDCDILSEQLIANLASIYSDIISPLGNRIQVTGNQSFLSRLDIQNRIRASLLAGIRAGILWQQVGGNRWQILFARRKILKHAHDFYALLSHPSANPATAHTSETIAPPTTIDILTITEKENINLSLDEILTEYAQIMEKGETHLNEADLARIAVLKIHYHEAIETLNGEKIAHFRDLQADYQKAIKEGKFPSQ